MTPLENMTPREIDKWLINARRVLAEARRRPTPDNVARLELVLGLLETLRRSAPAGKAEKIGRLKQACLAALPAPSRAP